MTDLVTPEVVKEMESFTRLTKEDQINRLCRDYLTLWDRNKELEKEVGVLKRNLVWFDDQLKLQELDTRETHD